MYLGIRHGLYESVMVDSGNNWRVLLQCALMKKIAVYDLDLCMVHMKMILKIRVNFTMISQFRLRWPT